MFNRPASKKVAKELETLIDGCSAPVITCHVKPDGDAVGSVCGGMEGGGYGGRGYGEDVGVWGDKKRRPAGGGGAVCALSRSVRSLPL